MKSKEPKFKIGDVVMFTNQVTNKIYYGTVASVNTDDGIIYGVKMDWDLKYHVFPESLLKGELEN